MDPTLDPTVANNLMIQMPVGRGAGKSQPSRAVLSIEHILEEWEQKNQAIAALKKIAHDLDTECTCYTCSSVAAIKLQYK